LQEGVSLYDVVKIVIIQIIPIVTLDGIWTESYLTQLLGVISLMVI
jgi:hypothetical protein